MFLCLCIQCQGMKRHEVSTKTPFMTAVVFILPLLSGVVYTVASVGQADTEGSLTSRASHSHARPWSTKQITSLGLLGSCSAVQFNSCNVRLTLGIGDPTFKCLFQKLGHSFQNSQKHLIFGTNQIIAHSFKSI